MSIVAGTDEGNDPIFKEIVEELHLEDRYKIYDRAGEECILSPYKLEFIIHSETDIIYVFQVIIEKEEVMMYVEISEKPKEDIETFQEGQENNEIFVKEPVEEIDELTTKQIECLIEDLSSSYAPNIKILSTPAEIYPKMTCFTKCFCSSNDEAVDSTIAAVSLVQKYVGKLMYIIQGIKAGELSIKQAYQLIF
ncbi:unnamed protein product [Moneuplotes crassus]|uniref:Uncharacterized protein n=1 Tax=Euplotes crassus TaxID=5936 RepID=A0AAD1XWI4_EUPCR|nr:unnamed protein product [Moneuplotes crassus]